MIGYFDHVVSSADIGFRKPSSRAFETCLDLLQLSSSETIFIGDNWDADVVGAGSANILPVLFGDSKPYVGRPIEHHQLENWYGFRELWNQVSKC